MSSNKTEIFISDLKRTLIVAGMLGIVQGLLMLIGGILVCFDRNKDVIFKSYCSLIVMNLWLINGIQDFISSSLSRISEIAVHQIAYALLIRQIEVGSRDSMTFVKVWNPVIVALQELMSTSLLCLLLLYVVFFGFSQEYLL